MSVIIFITFVNNCNDTGGATAMIAASIVGFCVCSTFCCVSLYGFSSLAIIFM